MSQLTNQTRITAGRITLGAYCEARKLPDIERKQDYTVSDAISDLLYYAASCGFDTEVILRSAADNLDAETIESCPNCGTRVTRENAYQDEGEREEAGRTFYYCSEDCRETH